MRHYNNLTVTSLESSPTAAAQVSASDPGAAEAPKMAEEAKQQFVSLGRLVFLWFSYGFLRRKYGTTMNNMMLFFGCFPRIMWKTEDVWLFF
jgi:hypothetical protein